MCGIAGIVTKGEAQDLRHQMQGMLQNIAHRGPDGEGMFAHKNFILGHRRLAILDLSKDGQQPMHLDELGLSIVFNGEIYNYLELKAELEQLGCKFHTKTDTEVILHAYQQWGPQAVTKFNGMWAFVIYEPRKNRLFACRDRFGVKPFYYINNSKYFSFCSEIKGLLNFLDKKTANQHLLIDYLLTQKTDHRPDGFFHGVEKLAPGHQLFYDLSQHQIEIKRYYALPEDIITTSKEQYLACLHDAIQLRLRADVPVGTCLSGGLDSSTVAALAAKKSISQPFWALTAVSEHPDNDESHYAQTVVKHCHLGWHTTQPSYQDFAEHLHHVMWTQEEPFASPSIVMQYFVMKLAKQAKIPVLLDGQGGDETLLGYERYQMAHVLGRWQTNGTKAAAQAWLDAKRHQQKLAWPQALKYLFGTFCPKARFFAHLYQTPILKHRPTCPTHLYTYANAAKDMLALQKLELTTTNLPALLRFEDKNAMAHAIETRLPFLDYRLVELALGLPYTSKIHQGWSKYILRAGLQAELPAAILWRKNKFGFEAPEKIWLAAHQPVMQAAVMNSVILQELLSARKLGPRWQKLPARLQWRLYTIALWEETFKISDLMI